MIRSESLKKNQDFKVVYQNGTSYANRLLVMYVLKNQHRKNRLGISAKGKGIHEIESAFMKLAKKHHITGNEHDKEISD